MQTKTISTMQPLTGQTSGAAISLVVVDNNTSIPCIQRIDGYMNGASNTQYWLHFFAANTAPANTTVPLFELQVVGQNGFSWDFGNDGGLDFKKMLDLPAGTANLIVCVSTTSGTFTAATSQTMDIAVTIDEPFLPVLAAWTVAGDLTTGVQALTVWADGAYHQLYEIQVKHNSGGTAKYLQLFTVSPVANAIPLWCSPVVAGSGGTALFNFGAAGFRPITQDVNSNTIHNGCYLAVSSTANIYTAVGGTPWNIRAKYV